MGVVSGATIGLLVALPGTAQAASAPVPLGTTKSFVVLAGAGITNTGPTTLRGDLGTYPTPKISGAGSLTVTGTNHHDDAVTQRAKTALVTAYNTAAGEGPTSPIAADLNGKTFRRGVYKSASSVGLTGELTLDAAGDPDAVFVFQAGSTLTTASGSKVTLINGASACNVFWQVGTSTTLGTGSRFVGNVLSEDSITATTKATVKGRLLARNGAVTLDTNAITKPSCVASASTPTPTPSPTPQIKNIPTGGVDSGGGSTSVGTNAPAMLIGGLLLAGSGAAALVAVRPRRRVKA
jgi:type VI secretion system secreted protein VgrG